MSYQQSPPPPPPAPHLPPAPKQRSPIPPPPPLPPNAFSLVSSHPKSLAEAIARKESLEATFEPERFRPGLFFFYGSLMDAEVLQTVAGLSEAPTLREAYVTGFSMKMWGIYPTLIRTEGGKVSGRVWKVEDEAQFLRLGAYETKAYTPCSCDIELSDGSMERDCLTFCWAGDPNSRELEEGTFDLQRYQRYFKPSVVRKRHGGGDTPTES